MKTLKNTKDKRWVIKARPPVEETEQLAVELGVDPFVAQLLLQRGIRSYDEAKRFFRPELSHLHDPFLMKDMDKAVARIEQAIEKEENILVYGDYDVDGTTAVSLLASFLMESYPGVATYIPDRYTEGYGVSLTGIDFAADNDISLIIALDCGVKAIAQVAYAKEKGIDFIICDHHRPGNELPDAVAVLDPKREDCLYPYKELCGCGIGFKLIQALARQWERSPMELLPYLDLVATAIGADIVPITGENRVLMYFGLQVLNQQPRVGIKVLLESVQKSSLTVSDVVFIIAPRINAAGRMDHGKLAVSLLMEQDEELARDMAKRIESHNADRKDLDYEITLAALEQIRNNAEEDRASSVVYNESWHKGVLGIVASRLMETYYRPTLVFTKSEDKLAASARSVRGFDVYNALEACSEHLLQFGGHKYAAGLTLEESAYKAFKERFEEVVAATIDPDCLTPEISVDLQLNLVDITPKFWRIIEQFAPFGPGNNRPVFMASELRDTGYAKNVGAEKTHLKMTVVQPGSPAFGAIGFNLGHQLDKVSQGQSFNAVFTLESNEWNGKRSLQLKVKDIKA